MKGYIKRFLDINTTLERRSIFLLGPLMSGKTNLIENEIKKPVLYWNLYSNALYYKVIQNPALLEETLKREKLEDGIVVIDEIERVPELLYTVHQFIEDTNLVFLLTASSIRPLKKEGVHSLGARVIRKNFHPLCYPELKDRDDYNLKNILYTGLLPEMYQNPMKAESLLEEFKAAYLEKEIYIENKVKDLPLFISFLEKAAVYNGKIINYTSLSEELGVSTKRLKTWYSILIDTFMIKEIKPYGKEKDTSHSCFYFFDTGVARSIAHMSLPTETMTEFGVLFETYIMMEITAYLDYSGLSRTELTYYRLGSGKREVDFIIGDDVAIEVKSAKNITDKHLVSLRELKEEGLFSSYIVVSREETPRMLSDSILILPWKSFLDKLWNGEIYSKKK